MFEQMLRQIIREELNSEMSNIPQYIDQERKEGEVKSGSD